LKSYCYPFRLEEARIASLTHFMRQPLQHNNIPTLNTHRQEIPGSHLGLQSYPGVPCNGSLWAAAPTALQVWSHRQVSISPTFYEQFFCTEVFWAAFLLLQFGFVIFWQKSIGTKAARKMLVKLTAVFRHAAHFMTPQPHHRIMAAQGGINR